MTPEGSNHLVYKAADFMPITRSIDITHAIDAFHPSTINFLLSLHPCLPLPPTPSFSCSITHLLIQKHKTNAIYESVTSILI